MIESKPQPIFLTGASRGIGAATARHFAAKGHPLALVARNAGAVEAMAHEINAAGGKAIAIACDVGDANSVGAAVARAVKELGGLGIVINNAGIIEPIAAIVDADPDAWSRALTVNLAGPMYVMHHAVPHLTRGVLRALAVEPTATPTAQAVTTSLGLSAGTVAKAVRWLEEHDLVFRNDAGVLRPVDPLMGRYLRSL